MHPDATDDEVAQVVENLKALGADVHISSEGGRTVVNGTTEVRLVDEALWDAFPWS